MMISSSYTENNLAFTEVQRKKAATWFRELRDSICDAFEAIEAKADPALYGGGCCADAGNGADTYADMCHESGPHGFEYTTWRRGMTGGVRNYAAPRSGGAAPCEEEDRGGGEMSMMRGRVFEKVGVHISTVFGSFSEEMRGNIAGTEESPLFWAAGISVIAHPRNPHLPAAHMNTRMITTARGWFGGGGDLNPMMDRYRSQEHPDTIEFLDTFRDMCARHSPDYFDRFREECDRYFYLPHRGHHRGVGGIFYDHLNTDNWDRDFAFTQDVGRAFLDVYTRLIKRRLNAGWTEEDRENQTFYRGRYAEFNLLYDRGTTFGLKTGGNVEAILSSLPPLASWP